MVKVYSHEAKKIFGESEDLIRSQWIHKVANKADILASCGHVVIKADSVRKNGVEMTRGIQLHNSFLYDFFVYGNYQADIKIEDYPSPTGNRRPGINIKGVAVKVIRPQDMPLQVANGNFDLAITGRDWLTDHRYQFPSSPVRELLDLKSGKVRIVAVVSQELPVDAAADLSKVIGERTAPFRVASEYVNIADRYARDNHLGRYRVIPTWGATEAFLPDDADLLIENTETGGTIARHNLKIIDTLFESTACLIGNSRIRTGSTKGEKARYIVETICAAVEGT